MKVSSVRDDIVGAIWMLHRVAPNRKETEFQKFDLNTRITPEFLEECILNAKEQGYRFVSLDEFINNKNAGLSHAKDIVISIDDGYRDIFEYAWPVFEKHQVPFVFYVASDFIEYGFEKCLRPELDGGQMAMDIIYHNQEITLDGKRYPASNLAEKAKCFNDFWKMFKRFKRHHTKYSNRELMKKYFPNMELDFDKYFKTYVCSHDDLRQMNASSLCTIGSHAKSHTPLFKIWNPRRLEEEVRGSQQVLENILGQKVEHFSYPYGGFSKRAIKLAKKYYQSAVSVASEAGIGDTCVLQRDDNYILPRMNILQGDNPLSKIVIPVDKKPKRKWYQLFSFK